MALERRKQTLVNRQYQRQSIASQSTTAQLLLETLKDRVNNTSWETQRELAEMVAGGVNVHTTIAEKGKKKATVTIRYLFSDKSSHCVSDHLACINIGVKQREKHGTGQCPANFPRKARAALQGHGCPIETCVASVPAPL